MEKSILDFKLDEAGEWTAILSCGHPQHVRHKPPFENREWILSEEGRNSKLGQVLNCVRCDELGNSEFSVPVSKVPYKI